MRVPRACFLPSNLEVRKESVLGEKIGEKRDLSKDKREMEAFISNNSSTSATSSSAGEISSSSAASLSVSTDDEGLVPDVPTPTPQVSTASATASASITVPATNPSASASASASPATSSTKFLAPSSDASRAVDDSAVDAPIGRPEDSDFSISAAISNELSSFEHQKAFEPPWWHPRNPIQQILTGDRCLHISNSGAHDGFQVLDSTLVFKKRSLDTWFKASKKNKLFRGKLSDTPELRKACRPICYGQGSLERWFDEEWLLSRAQDSEDSGTSAKIKNKRRVYEAVLAKLFFSEGLLRYLKETKDQKINLTQKNFSRGFGEHFDCYAQGEGEAALETKCEISRGWE